METEKKDTKFKPGQGGRPKGVVNKTTREYKERVEWVLGLLDETLEADLAEMKAAEKVKLWLDLQEFVRPKLQRMNLDVGTPDEAVSKITFEVVRGDRSERSEFSEGASGANEATLASLATERRRDVETERRRD